MKRLKLFISALVLSMSSLFVLATPQAFAATRTWDGGGSDDDMTTAANWSGDVAPSAGDSLVFPADVTDRTVVNDFTAATSFNSIVFSGAATAASNYTISGNSMTLVAGITNSMTGSVAKYQTIELDLILDGSQTFTDGDTSLFLDGDIDLGSNTLTLNATGEINIGGVISGAGGIVKTGASYVRVSGNNTYGGTTAVNAGEFVINHENGLGDDSGVTTVADGASLYFYKSSGDVTYAEPLTVAGDGSGVYQPTISVGNSFNMGDSTTAPYPTATFSGALTLQSDIVVGAGSRNAKFTGAISGAHTIAVADYSTAVVEIASSSNGSETPNGTLEPAAKETKYEDDQPNTSITVLANETAIVTGTYGDVNVSAKGILKGTGTVGDVFTSGTIAPGLSPGCLNTGDLTFMAGSAYEFELGGTTACTGYDQLVVTGGVTAGGTLNVSIFGTFKPVAGQKYVIVSNDASDPVSDTFSGLAQGATFTVGDYTFSISYTGGDGNDIELTVTAAPPVTGFALVANNPFVTMSVMLAAASAIAIMARRNFKTAARRR